MLIDQNTIVSAIVVVGWIFSLCFHEYGHGLAAYLGGDKSIKEKGYLSFNPFVYTNVGLSIVLPAVVVLLGGIGLPGAAVMVNSANLRGRIWESIVSFAGPLFSFIFTAALILFIRSAPPIPAEWLAGASYLAVLEIVVLIFNLLPVPGLDGFGIFEPFLPQSLQARLRNFQRYGILLLMAILWTVPWANSLLWDSAFAIAFSLGLDPNLVMLGLSGFRKGATPLSIAVILIVIAVHFIRQKTKAEREAAAVEAAAINSENEKETNA
jgi:Zn-dependent protease